MVQNGSYLYISCTFCEMLDCVVLNYHYTDYVHVLYLKYIRTKD